MLPVEQAYTIVTDATAAEDAALDAIEHADLAHQLAEQASPLQRRAHTIRLCALRNHHPGLPGLEKLITIINPDSAGT